MHCYQRQGIGSMRDPKDPKCGIIYVYKVNPDEVNLENDNVEEIEENEKEERDDYSNNHIKNQITMVECMKTIISIKP